MNGKQRLILIAAAVVITGMLSFPPWLSRGRFANDRVASNYAPIFAPPWGSLGIDMKRLVVQCLIVVIVAATAFFLAAPRKTTSSE